MTEKAMTAARRARITRMIRTTNRWIDLWIRSKELKESLDGVAEELERLMRRARMTSIDTPRGLVQLVIAIRKRPTKKDIVRSFGERRGNLFWERLRAEVSSYLTLTNGGNGRG